MSRTLKLTVCIPCFNEERYVAQAIESVLAQTYREFVLLVVDDCSTDGTLDVVRRFTDPRILIHRNPRNLGLYENQNACLALAETEYVKILCADDTLEPTCLSQQVAIMERDSQVVLVFGASSVMTAGGRVLLRRRFVPVGRIEGGRLIRRILLAGRNPVGEPSGVLFRRSTVVRHQLKLRAGVYSHMADLEFWIQLLQHGHGYALETTQFSFRLHRSAGTPELIRRSIAEHRKLLAIYGRQYVITRFERALFFLRLYFYFLGKTVFLRLFAR